MNEVKVLILIKNLTIGGAEKQSVLLAKALADCYEVHYVVLNAKYQEPKYIAFLEEATNIKLIAFRGNLLIRFIQFVRYLRENNIKFIFSYLTAANLLAVLAGEFANVPNIFIGIRNAYLPPMKSFVDQLLCNNFSTGTILNCKSGKDYFVKKRFNKDKITVIPNCFENIKPYKEKGYKCDRIKIITVGRFVAQKDYFTALEVMSRLTKNHPSVLYQIIGYGKLEEAIRGRIAKLKIESFIEIYINPANISDLLNGADIYLSTSLFEGTSNSIMEAMNADLPIVATNVGDNSELVRNGITGFLNNTGDIQQISEHLENLIVDRGLRIEMGRKGKMHLEENYSMNIFKRRYQELIEDKL